MGDVVEDEGRCVFVLLGSWEGFLGVVADGGGDCRAGGLGAVFGAGGRWGFGELGELGGLFESCGGR